ncbi:unnamed protein product [Paramecium sonneborni]|uniref:Uncharacterized protein n=1 Tax=Paramecium sonneborni TaxID=65129 RepID=A0A8S1PR75_9CILI|nr:unnamed protein product [Paramecium sonneborni]
MKKSKQFISVSTDSSIIIWNYNSNHLWSLQQILNGHSLILQCLVINIIEDIIINGSSDTTIKFCKKKKEWLRYQTITDHSKSVFGLSLNQQQNRVVSCGEDKYILIIEQQGYNQKWEVIKDINQKEWIQNMLY